MTVAEQIVEGIVTHWHSIGPSVAALAFAVRSWLNSRTAKRLAEAESIVAKAKVEESVAALMKRMTDRDRERDAEMAQMRRDLGECHDAREEQREVIASLEAGCAELRRIIDEMRAQLAAWERSLTQAGIPADDSDERDRALAELREAAEAHAASQHRLARIREVSARGPRGGADDR